jgi:hypothetical protein
VCSPVIAIMRQVASIWTLPCTGSARSTAQHVVRMPAYLPVATLTELGDRGHFRTSGDKARLREQSQGVKRRGPFGDVSLLVQMTTHKGATKRNVLGPYPWRQPA